MTDREYYNIITTIHLSFKNTKKISAIKHPESKILSVVSQLNSGLKSFNKDTFSVCCLLTQFKENPSSINSLVTKMSQTTNEDIYKFKDSIKNYKIYLEQDISYLKSKYLKPTYEEISREYVQNNIRFYTYYFYINYINKQEEVKKSRIFSILWKQLEGLMLFVKFREESVMESLKKINSIFGEANVDI